MLCTALLLFLVTSQQPLPMVGDDFHENEPQLVRLGYDPAFLALFQEFAYSYTGRGYHDREFRYRLFVPETSGPDDKRPLLVWLHGMSTSGDDNFTQLRHLSTLVFPKPWDHKRYPFFLLAVQCPHDNRSWTTGSEDVLSAILDQTLRPLHPPLDPHAGPRAGRRPADLDLRRLVRTSPAPPA